MSFKILFMGTPKFSVPILKSIYKSNHKVLEVYTQPPKKKNRGQKILSSPIHLCANELNLPVRSPLSINKDEELDHIKKLKPDIILVVAYGKILPTSLLEFNNIHFLNVHASLLPRWRGAAPMQRAIMNRDNETGVSIMKIESKLDSGPVLIQSKIKITHNMNCEELSDKMSKLGAKLIIEALKMIEENKAEFTKQNDADVTYAEKIQKAEAKIDWNEDASIIISKINALYPKPGCWFEINGVRLKILRAKEVEKKGSPGTVLDKSLTIACFNNAIQILEIQKEGRQKMTSDEFLRGNDIKIGQNLN